MQSKIFLSLTAYRFSKAKTAILLYLTHTIEKALNITFSIVYFATTEASEMLFLRYERLKRIEKCSGNLIELEILFESCKRSLLGAHS